MRRKKIRVKMMGTVILAALLGSNPCMAALAGQNPGTLREPIERGISYRISRSDFIKHTSDVSGGDSDGGSGNSDSGNSGGSSGGSGGGSDSGNAGGSSDSGSGGGGSGGGNTGGSSDSGSGGGSSGSGNTGGSSDSGSAGGGSGSGNTEGGSDSGNTGGGPDSGNTGGGSDSGNTGGGPDSGNTGGGSDSGNTGGSSDSGNTGGSSGSGNTGGGPDSGNTGGSSGSGNTGGGSDSGNTGGGPASGNTGGGSGSGNTGGGPDSGNVGGGSDSGNTGGGPGSGNTDGGPEGGSTGGSSGGENTGGGPGGGNGGGNTGTVVPGQPKEPIKSQNGLVTGTLRSQYFAGEGTEEAPYLIHSAKDLAMLSQVIEEQYEDYGGCYYQLAGNIVLKKPGGKLKASAKSNHTPIGSEEHPFYGTFDGNGYVIKNLFINEPEKDNQGLFGVISESGIVCSAGVTGSIVCGRNNTGALAGTNRGTIETCFQSGEVYGQENGTGGIAGRNQGEIANCYNSGDVNSGYLPGDSIPQQGGYGGVGDQAPSGLWDYVQTIAETIVETIAETLSETGEVIRETIDRVIAATQPGESPVPEESGGDIAKPEDTLEAVPDAESTISRDHEEQSTETRGETSSEEAQTPEMDVTLPYESLPQSEEQASTETGEPEASQEEPAADVGTPLTVIEDPFVPLGYVKAVIALSAAEPTALQGEEPETEAPTETARETDETVEKSEEETEIPGSSADDPESGEESPTTKSSAAEESETGGEETGQGDPLTLETLHAVNPATGEELEEESGEEPEYKAIYAMGGLVGINAEGVVRDSYQIGRLSAADRDWAIGGIAGWSENGLLENCYYLEGTAKLALPGEQTDDPTTLEEMSGETALGVMGLDLDIWMAREETADQEEHSEVETLGETGPGVKVEPAEETKLLPPGPIISGNRDEWTGPGAAAARAEESDMAPENAGPADREAGHTEQVNTEQANTEPADTEAGHTEPTNAGPTGAESENTESANAEPADTEPEKTQPADTQPADTQPGLESTESISDDSVITVPEEDEGIVVYRYYFPQPKIFRQRGQEQPYTLGFFEGGGLRVDSIRKTASVFSSEGFRWLFSTPDYLDYRITLEDNLDMTGMITSIGTGVQPFTGSLEGNGYKISGLKVPLFGVLGDGARVSNLLLDSAEVRAAVVYEAFEGEEPGTIRTEVQEGEHGTMTAGCGILAAYAQNALIYNCAAVGNINLVHTDRQAAQVQVGGLIGRITAGTSVSNSYAFVTLVAEPESRGPVYAGGLIGIVGRDAGAINCYATGLVQTTGTAGGFAAENYGEIDHCYVSNTISDKAQKVGAFVAYMPERRPEDIIDIEALRESWQEQKEEKESEKKSGKKETKAQTQAPKTVPESEQSQPTGPVEETGESQTGQVQETSPESKPETGSGAIQESQTESREENKTEGQTENPVEDTEKPQPETKTELQPETKAETQPETQPEIQPESKTAVGSERQSADVAVTYAGKQWQRGRDRTVMVLASTGVSRIIGRGFVLSDPVIQGNQPIPDVQKTPALSGTEETAALSGVSEPTASSGSSETAAPSGALKPAAPSGALKPTASSGVSEPTAPSGVSEPTAPSGVSEPTAPFGASEPTAPSGVSEPTVPSEPTASSAPSEPTASSGVSEPTAPSAPSETTAPSEANSPEDADTEASAAETSKTGAPAWIAQNRSINDCFYDKQMSGMEDEYALGLATAEMTGTEAELPGVWHLTQGAYPQLHTMLTRDVSEDFGIYSRASVIALFLPEGMSLEEAIKHAYVEQKAPLILPLVSDIDGEQIQWAVNGKVTKKEDSIVLGE